VIAAMDNTFLTVLLNPKAAPRPNPDTGLPVSHCKQRIEALIDEISRTDGTLLIPAPALAEALCATSAVEAYLDELRQYSSIDVAPFDAPAAYELGRVIREAALSGDKRSGEIGNWQQVKMDRAIVAIAISRSVDVFYSDDGRQINFAKMAGLTVKSTWDLALPDKYAQHDLSEKSDEPWPTQKRPAKSSDSESLPAK